MKIKKRRKKLLNMSCRASDGRTRTFSNPFSGWSDRVVKLFSLHENSFIAVLRFGSVGWCCTKCDVRWEIWKFFFHCLHFWETFLWRVWDSLEEIEIENEIEPTTKYTTRRWRRREWTRNSSEKVDSIFYAPNKHDSAAVVSNLKHHCLLAILDEIEDIFCHFWIFFDSISYMLYATRERSEKETSNIRQNRRWSCMTWRKSILGVNLASRWQM